MLTLRYIVERIETCLLLQGVEVGMGDLLSWVLFRRPTNLADFVDRSLESNSWFFFSKIIFPTQSVQWVYNMYYSWNVILIDYIFTYLLFVYGDILGTNMKGCSMCLRLYNNKKMTENTFQTKYQLSEYHKLAAIMCCSLYNGQLWWKLFPPWPAQWNICCRLK